MCLRVGTLVDEQELQSLQPPLLLFPLLLICLWGMIAQFLGKEGD